MNNKIDKIEDEEPFSEDEKKQYQAAYKKIDDSIDVGFYDLEKSYLKIEKIINKIDEKKGSQFKTAIVNFFSTCRRFMISPAYSSLSVALVFTLTGVVGWQMAEISEINKDLKNLQSTKTRSIEFKNSISQEQGPKRLESEITNEKLIKSLTPLTEVNSIINSALDSKLVAEVKQIDSGYLVIIHGMSAMNKDEVALKSIIGISNRLEGSIRIVIQGEK